MKIANGDAREFVQQRVPFQGSNIFAQFHTQYNEDGTDGPDTWYVVYSYGKHFPMYIWANGIWFANEDKYSRTTTRHQLQARPVSDGTKMHWLSTKWMQRLAQGGYRELVKARIVEGVAV